MFAVIYSFKVKPGQAKSFEKAWENLTHLIYEFEGSLGSRLHKKDDLHYIAYAQWPDKSTWQNSGAKLPESSADIRKAMKDACEHIETLYELDMITDLLKTETNSR
jgi:heme-degrading monooxygenase HmoA